MRKKAQSEIIGTILMILIVIAAVVIVANFVVPMVREFLTTSSNCLKLSGKANIESSRYTCYNSTGNYTNVQVHIGEVEMRGFKIELVGASSRTVTVKNGLDGSAENIGMFRDGNILKIPDKSGSQTYTIYNTLDKPDSIRLYPMKDDNNICDASSTITEVPDCYEA